MLMFNHRPYRSSLSSAADRKPGGDEEFCTSKGSSWLVQGAGEVHLRRDRGSARKSERWIWRDGAADRQVQGMCETDGLQALSDPLIRRRESSAASDDPRWSEV